MKFFKKILVGLSLFTIPCSYSQTIDTVDLSIEENIPFTIKNFQFSEYLIEGVKLNVLTPYKPIEGYQKATISEFLEHLQIPPMELDPSMDDMFFIEDDWSCWCGDDMETQTNSVIEYFLPSDLYHLYLSRNSAGAIESITISLPNDHPLNYKGIELPVFKLKWTDVVRNLKNQPQWYNPYSFADSLDIVQAFEKGLYFRGVKAASKDGNKKTQIDFRNKLKQRLSGKQRVFKINFTETYDILPLVVPGFREKDRQVGEYLWEGITSGEIEVFKSIWDAGRYAPEKMTLEEFVERYKNVVGYIEPDDPDSWGFDDPFGDNVANSFGDVDITLPKEKELKPQSDELGFMLEGEIIIDESGAYTKSPQWVHLILPYYHPNNMIGITKTLAIVRYSDLMKLADSEELKWYHPFDFEQSMKWSEAFRGELLPIASGEYSDVYGNYFSSMVRDSTSTFADRQWETIVNVETNTSLQSDSDMMKKAEFYSPVHYEALLKYLRKSGFYSQSPKEIKRKFIITDGLSDGIEGEQLKALLKQTQFGMKTLVDSLGQVSLDSILEHHMDQVYLREVRTFTLEKGKLKEEEVAFVITVFDFNVNFYEVPLTYKEFKKCKKAKSVFSDWKKGSLHLGEPITKDHLGIELGGYVPHDFRKMKAFWFAPVRQFQPE